MSYYIRYCSKNHDKVLMLVKNIGLESPREAGWIESSELSFSGWVLPLTCDDEVSWVVKYHDGSVSRLNLNKQRPDVLEHFQLPQEEWSDVGFNFSLNLKNLDRISIDVGGYVLDVWNVLSDRSNVSKHSFTSRVWSKLHSRDFRSNASSSSVNANDLKESFNVLSKSDFMAMYGEYLEDLDGVNDVFKSLADPYWSVRAIMSASEDNALRLPSFFSSGFSVCKLSIAIDDFNFLLFSDGSNLFYIVQHCANVSLVFPEKFLVVSFSGISDLVEASLAKLPKLLETILDNGDQFSAAVAGVKEGVFGGLNITQSRPYHYFYDYLYGLTFLLDKTDLEYPVYGVEGFDFFDVSLVSTRCRYASVAGTDLNKRLIDLSQFLVMPCVQYCNSGDDDIFESLASRALVCASNYGGGGADSLPTGTELVVWIGVSNEKRSWVEQIHGYGRVLSELKNCYQNIVVFVDGRTFPLNPRAADLANKSREDKLFDRLVRENASINFVNLIGRRSVEKIACAQLIDFFIASYATDSIYPSAFCRKPGVVFVSPSIRDQRRLHRHHRVIEVPNDKVKDVVLESEAWHEMSVSMDWRDVYECVALLIDKYRIRK